MRIINNYCELSQAVMVHEKTTLLFAPMDKFGVLCIINSTWSFRLFKKSISIKLASLFF